MCDDISTGTIRIFTKDHSFLASECKFMQFTGLLDKNGKEIYHKDFVQDTDGNTYRVQWDGHDAEFYLAVLKSITGFSNLTASLARDMEVIGNIYEDPKLIKT